MWQALIGPILDAASKQSGQQESQNAATRQNLMAMNNYQQQPQSPLQRFGNQNSASMSPAAGAAIADFFKKRAPGEGMGSEYRQGGSEPVGPQSAMGGDSSQMGDPNAWTNYLRMGQ